MILRPPPALARVRLNLIHSHLSPSQNIPKSLGSSSRNNLVSPREQLRMASSAPGGSNGNTSGGAAPQSSAPPKISVSDVSKHNEPLGPGKFVNTAGCIIIGDEVLNGKTKDSNSNYFAKFCFNLGIELKRIEVIADDPDEIAEAVLRMSKNYDFVVTSGGIGPTFDDITYESIGKAFNAYPLEYNDETLNRMAEHQKTRSYSVEQTQEMVTARKRMALFPSEKNGAKVEVIFPQEQLWVPVVRVASKVCILPGVPRLFEALIDGFEQYLPIDKNKPRPIRLLVHTKMPESSIAPFLDELVAKTKPLDIKVGSYPKWQGGVDVSLIGHNLATLEEFGHETEQALNGKIVAKGKVGGDD
ncbi:unnamed protein product [Sympodiomycopsis kandeliae]